MEDLGRRRGVGGCWVAEQQRSVSFHHQPPGAFCAPDYRIIIIRALENGIRVGLYVGRHFNPKQLTLH
ncbi:hypothetical protein Q8A67_020204 [Cirrhinus molitorella]|uniref:Uncharacterized protein n=1 Tax=Cirrhinus molitorella TaxID=172907 RepID=A0AA88TCN1_9TELE|nr:hypothetical protein Q8A67_020204 [Cirrhinus molitorella]